MRLLLISLFFGLLLAEPLDRTTCEKVCTTSIKALTVLAYLDTKVDLFLKSTRLVPQTDLACQRICLLPSLQNCVLNVLKTEL